MDITTVPPSKPEQEWMPRLILILRDYLMDNTEVNHLIEGEEWSDQQLGLYIILALDHYNNAITPITQVSLVGFPSLSLLLEGGAIYALKAAIFKYIRNAFQYNDSSVQVAVEEKAAEYERTVQRMLGEFTQKCQNIKEHINLEQCYGSGLNSEYWDLYIIGKYNKKR